MVGPGIPICSLCECTCSCTCITQITIPRKGNSWTNDCILLKSFDVRFKCGIHLKWKCIDSVSATFSSTCVSPMCFCVRAGWLSIGWLEHGTAYEYVGLGTGKAWSVGLLLYYVLVIGNVCGGRALFVMA